MCVCVCVCVCVCMCVCVCARVILLPGDTPAVFQAPMSDTIYTYCVRECVYERERECLYVCACVCVSV